MRKIMILNEKDFNGEPGDLTSLGISLSDPVSQVDDIFMIQPYNTIKCLKTSTEYAGQYSVADFVKYVLNQ